MVRTGLHVSTLLGSSKLLTMKEGNLGCAGRQVRRATAVCGLACIRKPALPVRDIEAVSLHTKALFVTHVGVQVCFFDFSLSL